MFFFFSFFSVCFLHFFLYVSSQMVRNLHLHHRSNFFLQNYFLFIIFQMYGFPIKVQLHIIYICVCVYIIYWFYIYKSDDRNRSRSCLTQSFFYLFQIKCPTIWCMVIIYNNALKCPGWIRMRLNLKHIHWS